jgi:hypothetical protein
MITLFIPGRRMGKDSEIFSIKKGVDLVFFKTVNTVV